MLTNPLWVVKTRLKLQRGVPKNAGPALIDVLPTGAQRYNGFVHTIKCIAREEGIRGFYKGLGPSLLLVRCSNAKCLTISLLSRGSLPFGSVSLAFFPLTENLAAVAIMRS